MHEPPFGRLQGGGGGGGGIGPMPPIPPHHHHHPALLDEMREREREREAQFGRGGGHHLPPHPAILEDRLARQHQDIQALLVDNQRLAATHVALKQELEAATHELQRMSHIAGSLNAEKDVQLKEVHEKSMKLENELHGVEAMRFELIQTKSEIQKLGAVRQELVVQVQGLTQDLTRANADLQQVPLLKADIDRMKQELERARAAIEYERKGHGERYEQGQAMEKNMVLIAREVEKLRAEVANGEMRVRASAAAVGNPGYSGNYNNPDTGYGGNPYASGYGMNPSQVQGAGAEATQYGQGQGTWYR